MIRHTVQDEMFRYDGKENRNSQTKIAKEAEGDKTTFEVFLKKT